MAQWRERSPSTNVAWVRYPLGVIGGLSMTLVFFSLRGFFFGSYKIGLNMFEHNTAVHFGLFRGDHCTVYDLHIKHILIYFNKLTTIFTLFVQRRVFLFKAEHLHNDKF